MNKADDTVLAPMNPRHMLQHDIDIPWRGPSIVQLDGVSSDQQPRDGPRFDFRNVTPGQHILTVRAFALSPAVDTVYLSREAGVAVWLHPRRPAVCLL